MGVCSGTENFTAAGIGKGNILVTIVGMGGGGGGGQWGIRGPMYL